MKKFFLFGTVVASALFLSGCSFLQPPNVGQQGSTLTPSANAVKGSLWRTGDGGHTFEVKSKINDTTSITSADIVSIAYHPKVEETIYVGSINSGIFKTTDAGDTWTQISFPPKGVYSFILDKNNPDLEMFASGVIDEWGKIFRTKDGGQNWEEVYTEPGQKTVVTSLSQNPKNTNILFAGTSSGTVIKSVDAGNTWKNVGNKINGRIGGIVFDAVNSSAVYVLVEGNKVYYSNNGGGEWIDYSVQSRNKNTNNSNSNQGTKNVTRISNAVSVASDPMISGTVYVGTRQGFFVSKDYAENWRELNIIESAKKFPIRSIAINPKNSSEIVFVAGRAFYKSSNAGETWEVTGLNVDRDASFVSYDPFDSKYLFIGLSKSQ